MNMRRFDPATGENDAELYEVRCVFDETNQAWIYSVSMPQRDKDVLDEICKSNRIGIEDLIPLFFQWTVREPEKAVAWLIWEGEKNAHDRGCVTVKDGNTPKGRGAKDDAKI